MSYIEIVERILKIGDELFEEMKILLLGKYLDFSIIDNDNVTKEMVCEKLCDNLEKILIKTNKTFDALINYYIDSMNDLIIGHLPKVSTRKDNKGKEILEDSRALKYFNHVQKIKKEKELQFVLIEDYTRVILCLYAEIIRKKHRNIFDFEFSFENVKCQTLINSLESEKVKETDIFALKFDKLCKRFKTDDKYSKDSFIIMMIVIMFYILKNKEVKGDY